MRFQGALLSGLTMLLAAPALAGSITPAPAEPVVIAPPTPYTASPDWTGFYAGGEIGWANIDTDTPGIDGDDVIGGVTFGYDYDFGTWVLGGALDYDWADITISSVPNTTVDSIFRAKLRGGRKVGNGLVYATGGYTQLDTNLFGSDDGYFIGAGYDHLIGDNFALGGEVLWHRIDNFASTASDADAVTIQIRGSFRF